MAFSIAYRKCSRSNRSIEDDEPAVWPRDGRRKTPDADSRRGALRADRLAVSIEQLPRERSAAGPRRPFGPHEQHAALRAGGEPRVLARAAFAGRGNRPRNARGA